MLRAGFAYSPIWGKVWSQQACRPPETSQTSWWTFALSQGTSALWDVFLLGVAVMVIVQEAQPQCHLMDGDCR